MAVDTKLTLNTDSKILPPPRRTECVPPPPNQVAQKVVFPINVEKLKKFNFFD